MTYENNVFATIGILISVFSFCWLIILSLKNDKLFPIVFSITMIFGVALAYFNMKDKGDFLEESYLKLKEECEQHLPRNQYCEVTLEAKEIKESKDNE